jgi:hypothetical protein
VALGDHCTQIDCVDSLESSHVHRLLLGNHAQQEFVSRQQKSQTRREARDRATRHLLRIGLLHFLKRRQGLTLTGHLTSGRREAASGTDASVVAGFKILAKRQTGSFRPPARSETKTLLAIDVVCGAV